MKSLEGVAIVGGLIGVVVVTVVLVQWLNRKRSSLARDRQRFDHKRQIISVILIAPLALMMVRDGNLLAAGAFGIVLITMLYSLVGNRPKPTDVEARVNFAHDSRRCGQCDYDLTGNVSGTCPECGWTIPESSHFVEPVHWAHWWKS